MDMTFIPVTAQHDENMPNNLYKNTKITIWKITVLFHCFYIPIVGICYSGACVLKQGSCLFSFLRAKSFYNQILRQRIHSSKGSVQLCSTSLISWSLFIGYIFIKGVVLIL